VSFLGTSKTRQAVHPPADAAELGGVTVRDLDDREVRLGELWEDQPAVLVFLRHYG
jgi:prostamide/prostaglandin F2alpha synthase